MSDNSLLRKLSTKISNKADTQRLKDEVETLKQELVQARVLVNTLQERNDYYYTKSHNTTTNAFIKEECKQLVNVMSNELITELQQVRRSHNNLQEENIKLQDDVVYLKKLMATCKCTSGLQDLDQLLESLQEQDFE